MTGDPVPPVSADYAEGYLDGLQRALAAGDRQQFWAGYATAVADGLPSIPTRRRHPRRQAGTRPAGRTR